MSERRCTRRMRTNGLSARVRPGYRVAVVNVSEGGALLEGHHALRPGAGIEVQFERSNERLRLAATVLRCRVSALHPDHGPTYRAAVAFGEPFAWVREATSLHGQGVPTRRAMFTVRTPK